MSTIQARVNVSAASPPPKTLAGYIPAVATGGQARLIGHHLGTDQLALAIGLPLRNQQVLTYLLQEVSTPHNPRYRHYLTQAQANQAFHVTINGYSMQLNGKSITFYAPSNQPAVDSSVSNTIDQAADFSNGHPK